MSQENMDIEEYKYALTRAKRICKKAELNVIESRGTKEVLTPVLENEGESGEMGLLLYEYKQII